MVDGPVLGDRPPPDARRSPRGSAASPLRASGTRRGCWSTACWSANPALRPLPVGDVVEDQDRPRPRRSAFEDRPGLDLGPGRPAGTRPDQPDVSMAEPFGRARVVAPGHGAGRRPRSPRAARPVRARPPGPPGGRRAGRGRRSPTRSCPIASRMRTRVAGPAGDQRELPGGRLAFLERGLGTPPPADLDGDQPEDQAEDDDVGHRPHDQDHDGPAPARRGQAGPDRHQPVFLARHPVDLLADLLHQDPPALAGDDLLDGLEPLITPDPPEPLEQVELVRHRHPEPVEPDLLAPVVRGQGPDRVHLALDQGHGAVVLFEVAGVAGDDEAPRPRFRVLDERDQPFQLAEDDVRVVDPGIIAGPPVDAPEREDADDDRDRRHHDEPRCHRPDQ